MWPVRILDSIYLPIHTSKFKLKSIDKTFYSVKICDNIIIVCLHSLRYTIKHYRQRFIYCRRHMAIWLRVSLTEQVNMTK